MNMLESDEVDDDFFTPVASTSLANIFGKTPISDEKSENDTLKYTPPKPQILTPKPEHSKATSCVFACVLLAYEWVDNVYTSKGKLGFAILKLLKTGTHNIVLYDSNKTTLSSTLASSKLEVTIKGKGFISYYDDFQKYWSLYGSENDIKKILDLIETFNVTINVSVPPDTGPSEQSKAESDVKLDGPNKAVESDTDSSINRKTKASILNRMANMGHSVLPTHAISNEKSSDSSDTNGTENHIKIVRHKPVKNVIKKNVEKNAPELQRWPDLHRNVTARRIEHPLEISNAICNEQLMPIQNTSIVRSTSGNDMNLYFTEQRISNSELRINMSRMTDKVDQILGKINNLEVRNRSEGTENLNIEILQKLLKEYESKIKNYEDIFQKLGIDAQTIEKNQLKMDCSKSNNEINLLTNKISELENIVKLKENDIYLLHSEIKLLKDMKLSQKSGENSDSLAVKISNLEQELIAKNEVISKLSRENDELTIKNNDVNVENKIKTIMNDTYHTIAVNFENVEMYSGETIKNIIATVIKKVTLNAINES